MSKRKIILVAVALCMVAILTAGGTLAYFMDTEQVKNTMVIGNVKIDIDEVTYTDGTWKDFEDDKFVLYPIDSVQGGALYNKMVYTANVSNSKDDAYIRTIVLFEKNTELTDEHVNEGGADCCFPGIHYFYHNGATANGSDGKEYYGSVSYSLDETVTIEDKEFWVAWFVQKDGEAIPYDACLYSLSSVWMDKNITTEQIAGWGTDNKVDVIVFSQGIQATGLTHEQAMTELGDVTAANVTKWITDIDFEDAVINSWTTKTGTVTTTPAEGE